MQAGQIIPSSDLRFLPLQSVIPRQGNPRIHSAKQIRQIAESIRGLGFLTPIIVDENDVILAGHGRWLAARKLGLESVPVVRHEYLSDAQKRAFVLADDRIAQEAGWDRELVRLELGVLADLLPPTGLDLTITGFAVPEFDALQKDLGRPAADSDDEVPDLPDSPVSVQGDVWLLERHRILCGDARRSEDFEKLIGCKKVRAVFTDPPFNLASRQIGGRGRIQHKDFAFAAGEMASGAYRLFLTETLGHGVRVSAPGAVHYICIDWRHIADLAEVADPLFEQMLNLVVWNKTNGGQGSFYRSQHELIGVFRVGGKGHRNNVELGRFGRNRSNVWTYAGVNTFGKDRLETLSLHPTVKPIALVADALLDCTAPSEIVLDQFAGSGTTLLAAEKVGRIGYGIEYDPTYVDVAIRRWEAATKKEAILEGDGRTFEAVQKARNDAAKLPRLESRSKAATQSVRTRRGRRHG